MISDTMPIANIKIGTRHRKDMGDIAGLAASIADVGLLHPIVVRADGTLSQASGGLRPARGSAGLAAPTGLPQIGMLFGPGSRENASAGRGKPAKENSVDSHLHADSVVKAALYKGGTRDGHKARGRWK
jgi:hypothetical protein